MEAWRQWPLGRENNNVSPSTKRIDLTPTGLLMEGHFTQNPPGGGLNHYRFFVLPKYSPHRVGDFADGGIGLYRC